jgi:hypothetical protein
LLGYVLQVCEADKIIKTSLKLFAFQLTSTSELIQCMVRGVENFGAGPTASSSQHVSKAQLNFSTLRYQRKGTALTGTFSYMIDLVYIILETKSIVARETTAGYRIWRSRFRNNSHFAFGALVRVP